jgi:hypothetical protein
MSGYPNPNQGPPNPYGNQPPQGFPQQNLPGGYPRPTGGPPSGGDDGDSGGGIPGWLIWIALLIGINVCSYLFDWPFWIY